VYVVDNNVLMSSMVYNGSDEVFVDVRMLFLVVYKVKGGMLVSVSSLRVVVVLMRGYW